MLFLLTIFAACSSTKNTGSSGQNPPEIVDSGYQMGAAEHANQSNIIVNPNEERPSNKSLNDMLQTLPGVRIQSGQGPYAKIVIGGTSGSFMSDTSPLFVVNGMAVGTDYSTVHSMVNPNDVSSLSVLKGSDASIYGSRGANGVIVIRTRKRK
ncbi:MAG: TonB-dependent receptor plug domain-containing protein [Bacteroidota bacterium]|nr:TonB-dependent receptor plug domain-containing protein [Bacteroidota bacterium]